jgi:hypothetical protein
MDHQTKKNSSTTLSIANLAVSITCGNQELIEQLTRRYADFLSVGDTQFKAEIKWVDGQASSPFLDASPAFKEGTAYFDAPGYQGYIDLKAGMGQLSLASIRPLEDIDYFLRVVYAMLVFQAGGLLFHAAGIVRSGKAYLFFGHSGSGKTTVSRLSPKDVILNDDLVLLVPEEAAWRVYSTPFWNPTQVRPSPQTAPLKGLYRLVQDRNVYLETMSPGQAVAETFASIPVISGDPSKAVDLLLRCRQLLSVVPVYRLHFLPDDSFWKFVE